MALLGRSNRQYQPGRRRRFLIAPLIIALAIMAYQFLASDVYVNPETGRSVRVALSPEQETMLGLQSFREILSQFRTLESGPEHQMVNRVAARLIEQVSPTAAGFDWRVEVIESEQVNAFCLPGGKIAVHTGILAVADNDDALAAVLGHEIAHATARHGSQRLLRQQLVQTAMMGLSGSTMEMDPEQRQALLAVLGAGVQYGIVLPYSREHELEADELGLVYLIRAGYKPEAAVQFWQRMNEAGGSQPLEWASTHPSHEARIDRLQTLIDEYRRQGTIAGRPVK